FVGVEAVAAVDDDRSLDDTAQFDRVDRAELLPLGEVQDDVCAPAGVDGGLGVLQSRVDPLGVGHGARVVHRDVSSLEVQLSGHGQRGRVAYVVGVRLERRAEYGDPALGDRSADDLAGQFGDPFAAAQVD